MKMTSKEALKCLQPFRWDDKEEINAYEVLEKLVERDTPKTVIKETIKHYINTDNFYEADYYKCPCCEKCGAIR